MWTCEGMQSDVINSVTRHTGLSSLRDGALVTRQKGPRSAEYEHHNRALGGPGCSEPGCAAVGGRSLTAGGNCFNCA